MAIRLPGAHDFADLCDGRCHYRLGGPADGRLLLQLHGATVPGWEFDRLTPLLNAAGFRTLCPDLYGHGYSERPRARYSHDLFVRQVVELLDTLGIDTPVDVIGHSLGAAIAARIAVGRPERIGSLVMTAPLLDFLALQPAARVLMIPAIGEALVHAYVVPMLKRRRSARYQPIDSGRFVQMYRDQFRVPGFGRALLSMIRNGSLGNQADCYTALAGTGHPVLVLRGAEDAIFTRAQFDAITGILPRTRFEELPGMGHPMMLTHPQSVAPLVAAFLNGGGWT